MPGSIHSAALSLHVQQLQPQEKDGKLALVFRTLSVTFQSGIPMLSPALLGGPVREAAWMSELEEAFAWALSLSFYRDGSVSVSEDLYRVSGKQC